VQTKQISLSFSKKDKSLQAEINDRRTGDGPANEVEGHYREEESMLNKETHSKPAIPLLLIVNGHPATGKTSVVQQVCDRLPASLRLDIDAIREMIPTWRDDALASERGARSLACCAADKALADNRDVAISQNFCDPEHLDILWEIGHLRDAVVVEVVLTASLDVVKALFIKRGGKQYDDLVSSGRSLDYLDDVYERLERLVKSRPSAHRIEREGRTLDEVTAVVFGLVTAARHKGQTDG